MANQVAGLAAQLEVVAEPIIRHAGLALQFELREVTEIVLEGLAVQVEIEIDPDYVDPTIEPRYGPRLQVM